MLRYSPLDYQVFIECVLAGCAQTHSCVSSGFSLRFCNIPREAGNNVQYIWSYYSVAELKKMMDAFDAWEGKGTVQTFHGHRVDFLS